jgi:pimeloyl-ACP methyl ester carboxylesterase
MISTSYQMPGLVLTDHEFSVPLDHAQPLGEQISVFARAVVAVDTTDANLPWLVFFQGGPGYASPRPDSNSGWLKRALRDYRVLLLDQRGTGRSTPLTFQTLARLPSPQAQADYMKHFRADAIVRDAELIRQALVGAETPWTALGQSFGGFCLLTYLSLAPQGLSAALITGGLASLTRPVDDVYRATYRRVLSRNQRFYERYPQDVARGQRIVDYLLTHDVSLPGGGRLTARRFQQVGMGFGASNGFEDVHYLLENAFVAGAHGPEINYVFLRALESMQPFDTNPIYALLHEPCYCQGAAANWSAARVQAEFPAFDLRAAANGQAPVYFMGEMVFPWMFEDYAYLQPLQGAAEILAAYDGWPRLYDVDVLRANRVPVAALSYYDDMYVEMAFAEETARTVSGLKLWVTNEYDHNGLRADGERVLGRLLDMLHGAV